MIFTLSVYESYFEGMKPELVDNVYHIDIHSVNVNQELKSELQKGQLMILFSPEIKPGGGNMDSIADIWQCVLFVVEKYNAKSDIADAERKRIRNECFETVQKIRKKMVDQAQAMESCHFLKLLDHRSFHLNKLGPVFNNMYGWSMQFDFEIPFET